MSASTQWRRVAHHRPAVGLVLTVALVTSLYAFEYTTGLPGSVRGVSVYPAAAEAHDLVQDQDDEEAALAPDPTSWDFKERLCGRVVRRFHNDPTLWSRVNERVLQRFGFFCRS